MADGLEPYFLGGESYGCMEVTNCRFDAGELINVVDGFMRGRPLASKHRCDVVGDFPRGGYLIKAVEGLLETRTG